MPRHRIKELLNSLPVNTQDAKKLLIDETGINYYRLRKILNRSDYKLSAEDLLSLSSFFSCEPKDLFGNHIEIGEIVKDVMKKSKSLKNLIKEEHGIQPTREIANHSGDGA